MWIGSASPICTGNIVAGNLEIHNNSGATTADGNTVNGNLDDHNNSGATAVFGNTAGAILTCKQDASITGGGNTGGQKQGQCAAF